MGQFPDRLEWREADQLDGNTSLVFAEIELDRLCRARKVGYAQDDLVAVLAQVSEYLAICRAQEPERAPPERLEALRTARMRRVQLSNDQGARVCASAFTTSLPSI